MKNYGLNLELEKLHSSKDDWVFGAMSDDCIADIPEDERIFYLPKGEVQAGKEDFMDCATRGPINILETKFNWLYRNNKLKPENKKWLEDNDYVDNGYVTFSDRFIAIKSGTTRQGNSMKAPLDAIHTYGLIPKWKCASNPMYDFDEYHSQSAIKPELEKLGQEFLKRFSINYEKVYEIHYGELLKDDLLDVAGYAWSMPQNGEYKAVPYPPNHVFIAFNLPKYQIFDNYIDSSDGDYIKKLASDYDLLDYGYRVYVKEITVKLNWLQRLLNLFR